MKPEMEMEGRDAMGHAEYSSMVFNFGMAVGRCEYDEIIDIFEGLYVSILNHGYKHAMEDVMNAHPELFTEEENGNETQT